MNTLANHGFLAHDGKNLTEGKVVHALNSALGFDEALAKIMFQQALPANPRPNATFFTLDQLNRHNVLEHDASMSRLDAYFGNNHTEDILDTKQLANGKLIRQINSRTVNPSYTFTETIEAFGLGEVAAPIIVFGSFDTATVNRTIVEFFFGKKRSRQKR
ncbi:hypothetical protein PV05_05552 [Exophiala xenobiotica]|uniref:Heme haloperoxidase family profile domain-containing protein n=1 Tax=Exophiala xenobiotica TaxID=348802 RepID=A0A0D2EQD0_9EURO|nr:uncharacterized protein PV05_05552 [Exophiala xenobiotica]KIW56940.1 hypothetical protein PV05_05552 [Exophiala xenobiotica]